MDDSPFTRVDDPLTPERQERIWHEVLSRIDVGTDGDVLVGEPDPRAHRRLLALVASVALFALLSGSAVLIRSGPGTYRDPYAGTDPTPYTVGTVPRGPDGRLVVEDESLPSLDDLAAVARSQSADDITLGVGEHIYARWVIERSDATQLSEEERWIAADGTGVRRIVQRTPEGGVASTFEEEADEPGELLVAGLTPAEIEALPTDPAAAAAAVQRATGIVNSVAWGMVEVLSAPTAPAAVRGALLEALADLGLVAVSSAPDTEGGPGITFAGTRPATGALTVVLDEATARPRQMTIGTSPDAEVITYRTTDTRSTIDR